MRVLLKEGAKEATAMSVLVVPQHAEATLVTLCGVVELHGIVGEADRAAVGKAIAAAIAHRPGDRSAETLLEEAEWMARALGPYEVGSRIGLRFLSRGWALDTSQAATIDRAPGLAEGEEIAVGPPVAEAFVNARGRVVSIRGDGVQVELDAGDRERIERSTISKLPAVTTFPRHCAERVAAGRRAG
jgi:hypothetical protein